MAARLMHRLNGLFCVYKPPGVHWKLVRDTVETNLLKDLNAAGAAGVSLVPREVQGFLSHDIEDEVPKALIKSAANMPILSKHPLVTGPDFHRVKVGVGHRLDVFSSGVLVLGVGNANKSFSDLNTSKITRDYTVKGEFGTATNDFSSEGRTIERSTYDHLTQSKLEKVLAMLQGANQKALLMYSRVDMRSQEAYEMAVQGQLGPEEKSVPIILGLRCIHFEPPNFTLEIQVINETQRYLRKVVHEIGLELRSTAVCKSIRRVRDGHFTVAHALTRNQWTAADVLKAVQQQQHCSHKRREATKQKRLHVEEGALRTSHITTDTVNTKVNI